VSTRVVTDTVRDDSDVITEDTEDYFAQQPDGTGGISANCRRGSTTVTS